MLAMHGLGQLEAREFKATLCVSSMTQDSGFWIQGLTFWVVFLAHVWLAMGHMGFPIEFCFQVGLEPRIHAWLLGLVRWTEDQIKGISK